MENESFGDLFPPFQSTANDIHEKVRLPHNNSFNSPLVDKIAVHAQRHAAKKKKGLRNLQGREKILLWSLRIQSVQYFQRYITAVVVV